MTVLPSNSSPIANPKFDDDHGRWQAVLDRSPLAEGAFFYSVRTTGVYCRPTCPARLPRRANVRFHATCLDAEKQGFRPCKRCQPTKPSLAERQASLIERACRTIEESTEIPALDDLANSVGLSPSHFHRIFKALTGLTPRTYAEAHRSRRVREELPRLETVSQAILASGISGNSRFYESSNARLGMTPGAYRSGGQGVSIRFAIGECWLGSILVASTDRGICAILLGDDPDALVRDLQDRFSKAELLGGDPDFEQLVAQVVGFVDNPSAGFHLPLDIRGTAFQQRVWEALRQIPPGSTATYTEIAERIGHPKSVRAVAGACASNAVAVAIPCHRVIRTDGSLSGYRWGVERKERLLERERGTP